MHSFSAHIRTYYGYDQKDPHLYRVMISSQIATEMALV
jgi:hypothetical protein